MYYQKFIEFLKEHNLYEEQMYKYWYDNSIRFDYRDEDYRDFISTYYKSTRGKIEKIWSVVPFIDNDICVLINIHEYVHFYLMYDKLGKKYSIKNDCEVLPIFFEKIYINENSNTKLLDYYNYLNDFIINSGNEEYLLAINLVDELVNFYDNQDINKLSNKVKKLVLKNNIKEAFNI